MVVVRCHVCERDIPTGLANEHHVVPQAAGGKDGPREYLCPTCHDTVHRAAEKMLGGRLSDAEEQAAILYRSPATRRRLYHLASIVAREMERKKRGELPLRDDDEVTIQITLPRQAHSRLRTLASELQDPRTKQRIGLARYAQQVLLEHLSHRGLWR